MKNGHAVEFSFPNLVYLEELHAAYCRERASVPPEWQEYFKAQANGETKGAGGLEPVAREVSPPGVISPTAARPAPASSFSGMDASIALDRVHQLIRAYRGRGHMIAQVHPIGGSPPLPPELDPSFYGFAAEDFDKTFPCETLPFTSPPTLQQIYRLLRDTYCRSIGVQYMHIDDLDIRRWLQARMEATRNRIELSPDRQRRILSRLTDAVIFEEFVRKKYLGAKTFSLEGCESLIPLLDLAIEQASAHGVKEIILGMAHRGRLNVLANILGKSPRQIFREFEDAEPENHESRGDVKYHLGYSNQWTTAAGQRVHLSLCFNPSHLEYVNGVALGRVRAKQDRVHDRERKTCMALLIHGDAAFAGEGVVQETLNLSQLGGYTTGGTLHIIVNNQIGFTTPPSEARSCLYATDVARMLQVPIFHVNGEDPEAVAQCLHVAMEFRTQFKRDVFIDMYGYRKFGHNETDEPAFTQPTLYKAIAERQPVREGYLKHLLALGGITAEEAEKIASERREHLEKELLEARSEDYAAPVDRPQGIWERRRFQGGDESGAPEVNTAVDKAHLSQLLTQLSQFPEDFTPHPKIVKMREAWQKMAAGEEPLDWAAAETLAYATLAVEGVRVRLSGQDSRRGTFSHRHAVLHDFNGKGTYAPLQHLTPDQAVVEVFNSPLSEAGVLGFDYGFSLEYPDGLVLWEAQFGDFVNAAQVIIDQFIASAESKWHRLSGLVLLLPHGHEGMGPEHSSARFSRFLDLCAESNLQVAYPTTPAQFFHLLRRQALRPWRKPLIVLTPKSLLRLPAARSSLEELAQSQFQRTIPDVAEASASQRVLLCGGKIYYELAAHREKNQRTDVAIIRLEQFYPLQPDLLENALKGYPSGTPLIWVQEEPANMGACSYLRLRFESTVFKRFLFSTVARPESASPASGSATGHKLEQARLIEAAFGEIKKQT